MLDVNAFLYFVLTYLQRYSFHSNDWGNPFKFGLPLDSLLNTIGMVLLCGMLKDVSCAQLAAVFCKAPVAAAATKERAGARSRDDSSSSGWTELTSVCSGNGHGRAALNPRAGSAERA